MRILPIGDEAPLVEYARAIQAELRAHQVRCELDASTDHIKAKISNVEQMKVHPADAGLVIGNRDLEANAVSVRGSQKRQPRGQATRRSHR